MMTGRCVYCKDGYNKKSQEPCKGCRNNPYLTKRESKKLPDLFVKGHEPEMEVEGLSTWA